MKKLLSLVLVVVMFATMSVTAFANNYTTSVTYDITNGNAVVKTTGTAVAGSEVTQILYTGANYETGDILYIDQATASSTGAFGFDYQIKADEISGLGSMMSIVGTDDSVVNFADTDDNAGSITLAEKVTVTVKNTDLYKDITVFATANPEAAVTVARGAQKNVIITAGAELTFNVGSTNYEYTIGDVKEEGTASSLVKTFAETATIEFTTNTTAVDMEAWLADGAYDDIMVWDSVDVKLAAFSALDGTYVSGDEAITDGIETANELSVLSKIANATGDYEYGIILLNAEADTLDETTEGAKLFKALGNSDGVWAIKAIDTSATLTTATVCTYVKVGETYRCGTPVTVTLAE